MDPKFSSMGSPSSCVRGISTPTGGWLRRGSRGVRQGFWETWLKKCASRAVWFSKKAWHTSHRDAYIGVLSRSSYPCRAGLKDGRGVEQTPPLLSKYCPTLCPMFWVCWSEFARLCVDRLCSWTWRLVGNLTPHSGQGTSDRSARCLQTPWK